MASARAEHSGGIARGLGLSSTPGADAATRAIAISRIHPDGSVDIKMGTQDIGTGTRTVHRRSSPPILWA